MKKGLHILAAGFLILTLTGTDAAAAPAWLQKVKNFFAKSDTPAAATQPAEPAADETPADPDAPVFDFSEKVIGHANAPLKISIFTSLTCPHCSAVHTQLLPYLEKTYVADNTARIVLADFPIDTRAVTASLISRCLTGENYFAFMGTLFENQMKWAVANDLQEALLPYAKLAGLSEAKMTACATDEQALKELTRQRNLAIMQYKVRATPTLIFQLGNQKETIEGAPGRADVDKLIEKMKKGYKGEWPAAPQPEPAPAPAAP